MPDDPIDAHLPEDVAGRSGLADLLGLEVEAIEDGASRVTLDVREALTNPYGGLHGAALYALADTGMGAAIVADLGDDERMATIEIKISYLRPVTRGTVTCETTLLNRGRSVAYLESDLENDGRRVARASGSFSIFDR